MKFIKLYKSACLSLLIFFFLIFMCGIYSVSANYSFDTFTAHSPIHVLDSVTANPHGLVPATVKNLYHLPSTGGSGTIAIITAYHDETIEKDLEIFDRQFGIDSCTAKNKCFTRHSMMTGIAGNSGWALETSLDVEWAHALAPKAKILLVETKTPSGKNLLAAIDYARAQKDVIAVSMSFGGDEFPEETNLDNHFTSAYGAVFFAASGDDGTGVSWPAVSPDVVAVGGTGFIIRDKKLIKENAWQGSGGGVSMYEKQPTYQSEYSIPKALGMRAVPDVAYNADPSSGYSVYKTTGDGTKGWYVVGGTSAGSPQWAAIQALGHSANNQQFYADKSSSASSAFFRDIISGDNGSCVYYCDARKHYDYVTGLGSPLTINF